MRLVSIADVHILSDRKHGEYKLLLDSTVEKVREIRPDFICLLGDYVNSNTVLSPESVTLLYDFVRKLCKISTCVAIAGNHDGQIRNQARKNVFDLIEHLLEDEPNFHHFAKSGLYGFGNTVFGAFSLYDDKANWPIEIKKEPGKTYIALYHGPLDCVYLDSGVAIESTLRSDKLFGMYDQAMLGDIHARQFLDPRKVRLEVEDDEVEQYKNELDFRIVG